MNTKWFTAMIVLAMGSPCLGQNDEAILNRLKEMKSDDAPAAQVAEMEIVAMGGKAIGALEKIIQAGEKNADYESANRIYPAVLEKAGRLTRISIHCQKATLQEVLDQLNAQCKGVVLEIQPGQFEEISKRGLTIDWDKVPYNQALVELGKMVEGKWSDSNPLYFSSFLIIRDSHDPRAKWLRLQQSNEVNNIPVSALWGNVVFLESLNWVRTLDYEGGKRNGDLTVEIRTMMDPAMKVYMDGSFAQSEAMDDTGNKLWTKLVWADPVSATLHTRVDHIRLEAPKGMKKLTLLKGKETGLLGKDIVQWTIEDLAQANGKSHAFGEMTLEIGEFATTQQAATISGKLTGLSLPQNRNQMDNHSLLGVFLGDIFSLEAENLGGLFPFQIKEHKETKNPSDGKWTVEFKAAITLDLDWKTLNNPRVKVTAPKSLEDVQIGFEFKDITLP